MTCFIDKYQIESATSLLEMNSYFLLWNHHSTEVQQLRVRAVVLVDHHTFVPAVVVAGVRRAILLDSTRLVRAVVLLASGRTAARGSRASEQSY